MLETFKDIILPLQYYTIIKKVLINILNNLANTKEITVSQKNKGNYKIVYREGPQVQKMHSKKQNLSYHSCCLLGSGVIPSSCSWLLTYQIKLN